MVKRNFASRRCTKGYRTGFNIGRSWAQIVRFNKQSESSGKSGMRCTEDFISGSSTVFNVCAKKGMAAGFKRFWKISNDQKALKAYKDNRQALKNSKKNLNKFYASVTQAVEKEKVAK